jgi:hypothetical protein
VTRYRVVHEHLQPLPPPMPDWMAENDGRKRPKNSPKQWVLKGFGSMTSKLWVDEVEGTFVTLYELTPGHY